MPSTLPVLYSFRRCPYAIRARLALCCSGTPVELREVNLKRKPAELLAISPTATVPVLDLGQGRVLKQSLDILHWALQQNDPEGWLQHGDPAFNQWLVDTTDGAFKHWLDRYKYAERFPERSATEWRDDAVRCLIEPLEARLAAQAQVGGQQACWADAAVFPFVRQFAAVDPAWWAGSPWQRTRCWLQGWLTNQHFLACMHKAPVWSPGAPVQRFPPPATPAA
ncbi:glutathione S-transferase [Hydrogenophaga palleronii]|uniref:Glutathione S-transferase n=1 Tax=Hydrogenophaga palleronii TaxID=65655 RepID=A0ABU1WNC1_9BURK|nr:glutathione S-transferase [Hydrogenophaga palleronii]MDR7150791.1 glutathione S-transferase [Hydrogenophaga palleronii]